MVRNPPQDVVEALKQWAAKHGRSAKQEHREILQAEGVFHGIEVPSVAFCKTTGIAIHKIEPVPRWATRQPDARPEVSSPLAAPRPGLDDSPYAGALWRNLP